MEDLDRLAALKEELLRQVKQIGENTKTYKQKRAERAVEIQKRDNMGLGQLADPQLIFVRKFRWTMKSNILQEHFVKRVDFDFAKQIINMEVMEVVCQNADDINVQQWLESPLANDTLVFTTYDGCGNALYQYEMSGLQLLSDWASFDYCLSDESSRKVGLYYTELKRTYFGQNQKTTVPKKAYKWKLRLSGGPSADLYDIDMKDRPNLDIEETEINFLNSKMWIPGKAKWDKLTFVMERQHDMKPITMFMQGKSPIIDLCLYDWQGNECLEKWILSGCQLTSMFANANIVEGNPDDKFRVTISFKNVEYKCEVKNEQIGKGNSAKPKGECYTANQIRQS
jgi:hypothetical protein